MEKKVVIDKGAMAEEYLRHYFLRSGYFAVRSVPFVYEDFDVTDVDVWLYGRASSISREITIVDIKNKKTPQAIERIFWVKGLKSAVGATNAVVATTDCRQAVKDFGKEQGVSVLDGTFLSKLRKTDDPLKDRISQDEFCRAISWDKLDKLGGDWLGRTVYSKSLLLHGLSFDTCIAWLNQGQFFAEQAIARPNHVEGALRCLYFILSLVALAIDFVMREFSFLEQTERNAILRDGFTYGTRGSSGMKRALGVALGLVEQHSEEGISIARKMRASVERDLSALKSNVLAEYFARNDVSKSLFSVARELEYLSMQRHFKVHTDASLESRSLLLCCLDYWGIDRVLFGKSIPRIDGGQTRPSDGGGTQGNLV